MFWVVLGYFGVFWAWFVLGRAGKSTGFDLLLQTLRLPAGSEVLCSAITIPDMIHVLRHHNLVPVPVDVDFETLAVDGDALERAVTKVGPNIHHERE